MIKLIIFDLDDTLFNSRKQITKKNYDILMYAKSIGIKLACNTARTPWSAEKALQDFPLDAKSLCSGAIIYKGDKIIYESNIPAKQGKDIIENFRNKFPNRKYFTVCSPYTYISGGAVWKDDSISKEREAKIRGLYPYQRIVFIDTNYDEIKEFANPDFKYIASRYGGLSITSFGTCKGKATEIISDSFGIKLEDTVAFGDDLSDIEMIKKAGVGVAMRNSMKELKKVADGVALSCDQDGIGIWLKEALKDY